MGEITKAEIEKDIKKIFDCWQQEAKQLGIEENKLKQKHNVINLEYDEDNYTFEIKDEIGKFMVEWDGQPVADCPMTDKAEKFVKEYYQLYQVPYDKARDLMEELGYMEYDNDIYYTAWKKGSWIVTVPIYPETLKDIEIEEDKLSNIK